MAVGEPRPRTWPWLGARLSGPACGMAVDGHGNGGIILRTNTCPSTAISQVPPGLLQDILLEQNLRNLLDLVDRTGYTTSDVMYIVEQIDIVEQTGYVDRKG